MLLSHPTLSHPAGVQRRPLRLRSITCSCAAVLTIISCGCSKPLNNLDPAIGASEPVLTPGAAASPSLEGLSRDHWPHTAVHWTDGRVAHDASMPVSLASCRSTPRQVGTFPTIDSVSDESTHRRQRAAEGLLAPVHGLGMIALSPWEIVKGRAPWVTEYSPAFSYDRSDMSLGGHDIGVRPAAPASPEDATPPSW